ncbi:NeuD/PglB/VioB family sugar acetyltransferase [Croceimicrobium sp.]|uniref:NeuD/PglB/VioB family sugar acetyltransferase n=1 Tax=Croceimicrobium sp. TaxID=2828340 RepID=UPI003BABCC3D
MNQKQPETLHIVPSGGFSSEVQALAKSLGYNDFKFYDDGIPSFKKLAEFPSEALAVIAAGSSELRMKIVQELPADTRFPTLIHKSVLLMDPSSTEIGKGTLIAAASVCTTNIQIGNFVVINLHCSIGHGCKIADFVSLMPGVRISGEVKIHQGAYLGSNAVILPNITIGENATIGAGAVVTKDVAANTTVAGVPAKPIITKS